MIIDNLNKMKAKTRLTFELFGAGLLAFLAIYATTMFVIMILPNPALLDAASKWLTLGYGLISFISITSFMIIIKKVRWNKMS